MAVENDYTTAYSGTARVVDEQRRRPQHDADRSVDLGGVKSATLTAKVWYDIEAGFDYLFLEYSTDGGDTWTQVGDPLDGSSKGHWKGVRYAIPGGADDTLFRFRYQTDGGVHLAGAFIDDITIKSGGTTLFTDDVESGVDGWTADGGFKISTGTESTIGDRYYIAENRTYVGYDAGLQTGPYQFSFALTDPDKVEHFAFEDGLLVWMVDETYTDNNNSEHTGHGLALPVDARPAPFKYAERRQPSNRRQPFDATFGLQAVPAGPDGRSRAATPIVRPLPCAGLHKQVVVGKGKTQSVGYLCAWPTEAQRAAIPVFTDTASTPTGTASARRSRRTSARVAAAAAAVVVAARRAAAGRRDGRGRGRPQPGR